MINAMSFLSRGSFYQSSVELFLPVQYLGVVFAMAQGGLDLGRIRASSRNHSQLVKTLFPCELMPFLQLFMETAQHYLATSGMTLSFPSEREHCQRLLPHVTVCPDNVTVAVTAFIHVDRRVCTCKILEAEAKQGPFQKQNSATLQAFWVTAIFTAMLESGVLGASQMFWVCLCRLKDLWEKSSTRKQFSFLWFLSISVNWHHVCDLC